jgi:hypothetical protein
MSTQNLLFIAALQVSLVFGAGCAANPDDGDPEPEALSVAEQELDSALIKVSTVANGALLSYGHCTGDGYVVRDGTVSRLGVNVGTDATGITTPAHSVCHNTTVWKQGSIYVCNSNRGTQPVGTFSGAVPGFDEWVGNTFVRHPASVATHGLNFAHTQLSLCETPSHSDYKVVSVECCAGPATP